MEVWMPSAVTIVVSVVASSGFWSYMQRKDVRKGAQTRLLLGLAHDRIVHLGMNYLERGWMTKDEYEDFLKYLYEPYAEFGGNGLAKRVVEDLMKIPIVGSQYIRVEEPKNE